MAHDLVYEDANTSAAMPGDGQDLQSTAPDPTPERAKLVKRIIATVKEDKAFHKKSFERMKRDMFIAMHGRDKTWNESSYKANISGRHVKMKTAALYAKNPKIQARRRNTLDFKIWDESPDSLMMAFQGIQMAQQALAATPMRVDPLTNTAVPASNPIPVELRQAFEQAQALVADYKQGMERRQFVQRLGKTLEVLFSNAMKEQKPLDFKTGAKQLVRRTCTTGVGYVELGFQRETGPRIGLGEQLADARARLDHLRELMSDVDEGEIVDGDAEIAELEASISALLDTPEIVLREGLVFDFPASTSVIPDKMCRSLVGFVGARHLTVEYQFTAEEVEEMFPGVEIGSGYAGGREDGFSGDSDRADLRADVGTDDLRDARRGLVKVWKHYDKPSGLVYYVAEGYKDFLREPAAPDVFVEDFWPVYALTFNAVESEDELFPPSDVTLLYDMQQEFNNSRQGLRQHRKAAQPRYGYARGAVDETDIELLKTVQPFEAIGLNKDPQTKIADMIQVLPVPGVDPNLYETRPIFSDMELVVGSQPATLGGLAKATATESAISANAMDVADQSSTDDLDSFLSTMARAAGQILMREMSVEQVNKIVGPGAVWVDAPLEDIVGEVYLDIEAGSTGKPNRAVEIQNWQQMLPFLIQMPTINPTFLARETLRRLDDNMDLTDAIVSNLPSIVLQNSMKQAGTGNPATDPAQQGAKGAANAPKKDGPGQGGSGPAFGSNQV